MTEEQVYIDSGRLKIEGLLEDLPGARAVVVTHPHPLYGGDMNNNVVEAVCRVYRKREYSTLKFNFRGTGQSEGSYGDGMGEQDDVMAALNYLTTLGKKEIDLVGYSFGAWVNAMGIKKFDQVKRMIMISPPVDFVDFSFLTCNSKIRLVISGSDDDIAGVKGIEEGLPVWNPEAIFRVVQGADHFYQGKTGEMEAEIDNFLDGG
ncbi:alpha/beta hydrolase [Thermodesulfobacteriota bacterium]